MDELMLPDLSFGKLIQVQSIVEVLSENGDDYPWELGMLLTFQGGSLIVVVDTDCDTIRLLDSVDDISCDFELRDVSQMGPWSLAIGKPLLWSWQLKNQQGYIDAIQIHLRFDPGLEEASECESIIIQLLAIASELFVYQLLEVER